MGPNLISKMKPASGAEAAERSIAIDWLRGAAAIAVLLFHAREVIWVGLTDWLHSGKWNWLSPDSILGFTSVPLRWGYFGVPLFFVISGYCIHRPYVRAREFDEGYRFNIKQYLARRLWRIYPTLLAALLLTAGLDCIVRSVNAACPQLGDDSIATFLANLFTLQNIAAPTYGSNVPLWTLSIELHFYLVYPLLYLSVKKGGLLVSMLVVSLLSLGSWLFLEQFGTDAASCFFLPFWFSWVSGACIAEAEARRVVLPTGWLVLAAVPCLIVALRLHDLKAFFLDSRPLEFALLSLPSALLLWFAIKRPLSPFWSCRPSRALALVGLFSYSLYATHVPTLLAYRALVQGGSQSSLFVSVIPAVLVAIGVAYVVYLMVEQWSLKLPSRVSRALARQKDPRNSETGRKLIRDAENEPPAGSAVGPP
jgi:peptidoglycan/LPS O-acetylase OafA/YrhL